MVQAAVIIEIGEFETLAGFSYSESPIFREPSLYALYSENSQISSKWESLKEISETQVFGKEAIKHYGVLEMHSIFQPPAYTGLIAYIRYCYERIDASLTFNPLILILPQAVLEKDGAVVLKLLFTELLIPKIAFLNGSECILTSFQRRTGLIIDFGYKSTRIEGIVQGFPKFDSLYFFPYGGFHISSLITQNLHDRYPSLRNVPLELEVEKIKRNQCRVTSPSEVPVSAGWQMADDTEIALNPASILSPSLFFSPIGSFRFEESLPELVEKSIRSWGRDNVKALCENILICGGGASFPGLITVMKKDLEKRFPPIILIDLHSSEDPKGLFWAGGQKIAQNLPETSVKWKTNA